MNIKRTLSIASTLLALVAAAGSAHAFSLTDPVTGGSYNGPIKIKFSNWEVISPSAGLSDGVEDNWGVLKVTSIEDLNANQLWSELSSGEQVSGMFYNLDIASITSFDSNGDLVLDSTRVNMSNAAITGKLDLYLQSTSDLVYTSADPNQSGAGPTARTGFSAYPTFTDGSLLLSADFTPGILPGVTVSNVVDTVGVVGSGKGQGYAAVTGGSAMGMFDSNGYLAGAADLYITYDFTFPGSFGWSINSEDPTYGTVVPEPGTLLLLGSGLVGIGVAARLRKRKIA